MVFSYKCISSIIHLKSMPLIHLTTFIAAPIERVFDLSRSIDLHKKSMAHTNEQAVAGTTTGLIEFRKRLPGKQNIFSKQE